MILRACALHNYIECKGLPTRAGWIQPPQEQFEDTKGVIIIRKLKKNRHHNRQKKKNKRINNDLPNTTQKTKDRVT